MMNALEQYRIALLNEVNEYGIENMDLSEESLQRFQIPSNYKDIRTFYYYKKALLEQDLYEWQEDVSPQTLCVVDSILKCKGGKFDVRSLNKSLLKYAKCIGYYGYNTCLVLKSNHRRLKVSNELCAVFQNDISKETFWKLIIRYANYSGNCHLVGLTEEQAKSYLLPVLNMAPGRDFYELELLYNAIQDESVKNFFSYVYYRKYIHCLMLSVVEYELTDIEEKLEIIKSLEKYYNYGTMKKIVNSFMDEKFSLNIMRQFLSNTVRNDYHVEKDEERPAYIFEYVYTNCKYPKLFMEEKEYLWDNLLRYCVLQKKKAFLQLLDSNLELIESSSSNYWHSVLFNPKFWKYVNLNTLNLKNVKSALNITAPTFFSQEQVFETLGSLTFAEFEVLANSDSSIVKLYGKLQGRVDDKILIVQELNNVTGFKFEEESMPDLVRCLNNERFSNWRKKFEFIRNLNKEDVVKILSHYSYIQPYLSQVKDAFEINFLIRNMKNESLNKLPLDEMKKKYMLVDENCKDLFNLLELSDEFIAENHTNIQNFCTKDLAYVSMAYYHNSDTRKLQKDNLLKLVKAEFAGKLKDIKYLDLEEELAMSLSDETKNLWIENKRSEKKDFFVEEHDDFETIMKIGVLPNQTCMHYECGSYAKSLLCNFDSNKKILNVIDKTGVILGRAILRFTKTTERISGSKLNFIDVTMDSIESKKTNSEKPILFLEKAYLKSGLKPSEEQLIEESFVEFARQKADEMNVDFVASQYYHFLGGEKFHDSYQMKVSNVYVSFSKNGVQYLDSFNGETSIEGRYLTSQTYVTC